MEIWKGLVRSYLPRLGLGTSQQVRLPIHVKSTRVLNVGDVPCPVRGITLVLEMTPNAILLAHRDAIRLQLRGERAFGFGAGAVGVWVGGGGDV